MRKDIDKKSLSASGMRSGLIKFNSERAQKGERKKVGFDVAYLFSAILTIAVAVFSVGLVIYFGYHLVDVFTEDVTYSPSYPITETEYRRGEGYIFRDELIIVTDSEGTPDYKTDDGVKLGIGEHICDLYASVSSEARERIAEINSRLSLLEMSLGSGVVKEGIPEALRDSNQKYDEIMAFLSEQDYSGAARLSDTLLSSLLRLGFLENGADALNLEISNLKSEKNMLLATYGKVNDSIYADQVGYFFRDGDGYESIFDPSLLDDITIEEFSALIAREPNDVSNAIGKIVMETKWYLTIPFDGESAQGFTDGKKYNIVFHDNDSRKLSMTLERTVLDLDDHDADGDRAEALLIFSTTNMPSDFRYLRRQSVSVEAAEYNGYRIPITAVRYYDGMTGVYVLAGGHVLFRQIDILYEASGYCIAALYSDAEPGKPLTYNVLGYEDRSFIGTYAVESMAESLGLTKTDYYNGGIPVSKGRSLRYFYHLNDLEQIILTGKDLHHGKALD